MKKLICVLLALMFTLLCCACAARDPAPARIESGLTAFFTCPDPEVVSCLTENTVAFGEGVPERTAEEIEAGERAREAFGQCMLTKFSEDIFADAFRRDLSGDAYMNMIFPVFCASSGKTITVESVTAELELEKSRVYRYTAELLIEDKNGNAAPFTQTGKVQLDEAGKICYIDPDFDDLCTRLTEE